MFFDHKGVDMVALGLRNGIGVIKNTSESLLSDKEEARIIPKNFEEMLEKQQKKQQNSTTEESKL